MRWIEEVEGLEGLEGLEMDEGVEVEVAGGC
jgi:hypothetical protein